MTILRVTAKAYARIASRKCELAVIRNSFYRRGSSIRAANDLAHLIAQMPMRLTTWRLLVASSACLFFLACSSEPSGDADAGPGAGETDAVDGTADSGEVDAGTDTNVPDVDVPDTPTDEDVVTPTDTGDAETDAPTDTGRDDDVTGDECREDSECGAREVCVDGFCLPQCGSARDCDDGNPCTRDACGDLGVCEYEPIDASLVDPVEGDCLRQGCVDGSVEEIIDADDVPADDGIACTIESCAGRVPVSRPEHLLCDDGDELNGEERCVPEEGGCVLGEGPAWACEEFIDGYVREEVCGDGQDNDGNGLADEGCECEFGSAQRCFVGPPNARDVGGCVDGIQRCVNRESPEWSECEGGSMPQEEICDSKDNDCDGCIDDIPDCSPILACPSEDFARPLRWYPLDGEALFGDTFEGLDWTWNVIPPPNSSTRTVEDPAAATTRVYLDVSGDYQISLTVEDDKGDVYGCSWVVRAAGSGLRVEMRWDTFGSVDMDLHMARATASAFCDRADDCYYANCRVSSSLDWGYSPSPASECEVGFGATSCPNPRLDIDNIRGFDPENINLDNPEDGDGFRVMAHKFSGTATTNPVVSIYCGGALTGVFGEAPDGAALDRAGGGCQGNTWRVADVTMIVEERTGATSCVIDVLESRSGGWDIRTNDSSF